VLIYLEDCTSLLGGLITHQGSRNPGTDTTRPVEAT
jgi:hypothetical protein